MRLKYEPDVVPDDAHQSTIHSTCEEGVVPSNIYEYFVAIENGQFPFFNNTATHVSAMRNAAGETLLIAASRLGHADIVERLVNDIDIEETDNDGWTALLCASYEGHAKIVHILLDAGASIEQSDLMGWTPMLWACYKNHVEVVDVLIAKRAHINIVGEEDGLTPLLIASGRGYAEIASRLLVAEAQVNASDKFGNTALIWAARKGFKSIVEDLLAAGAEVDAVGMQSSTALMLATRGNYGSVVDVLLSRDPNVNIVDYNGLSALHIAAREGYTEIAHSLIQSGAFVNTIDRFGNSILASAVRSGNIYIVRLLLEKHADVNAKDSEGRTALHLAIDKAFMDIVMALIEKRPNLELKNKDGDTALIRAVKTRDIGIVQLLVSMGAKISATDNLGDNSLHLALRSRSKKLAQILLINPGDSKLLYRPNKSGETPYSIDQESNSSILPSIFGSVGADTEMKSFTGYDIYSDVLADIVCEPNLSFPLIIGLYSKWGSGKSFLLPKIRDSMRAFSRSWTIVIILFLLSALLTAIFSSIFVFFTGLPQTILSLVIGSSIYLAIVSLYGFIYYGSEIKLWNGSIVTARLIARWIARFKFFLSVLTLNAPIRTDKELIVSPVGFLFADDHKLSFIGGEQALANIVKSLFAAAEAHYGALSVRLFLALRIQFPEQNSSTKLQTLCGIPIIFYSFFMFAFFIVSLMLYICSNTIAEDNPNISRHSLMIAALVFMAIFICCMTTIFYVIVLKLIINSPKRRINRITRNLHSTPFEQMVQKLQREIDILTSLVKSLDAFTNSQTRLVIMVDGLDSFEQNKMLQLLDALSLFFCSRQNQPFIVVLAIDPNIFSKLGNNLRTFSACPIEISGSDYVNTIVTMPFFLDQSYLMRRIQRAKQRYCAYDAITPFDTPYKYQSAMQSQSLSSTNLLRDRRRSETLKGSRLSLTRDQKISEAANSVAPNEFGPAIPSYDHLTNINHRIIKRIMNSIALTGRLLRIFEISFSWTPLYAWISLIEQWPLRMSWLIDIACSHQDDALSLNELYGQIKHKIVIKESMSSFDRNYQDFENALRKITSRDLLNVGHAKAFSLCTSNLDPSLRKFVREQRGAKAELEQDETEVDQMTVLKEIIGDAEFLFDNIYVWTGIMKQLPTMTKEEVVSLIKKLNIPNERLQAIVRSFDNHNLNGMVLHSCDLEELKSVLKLPLGDWVLIKVLIETLRRWKPILTSISTEKPLREIQTNSETVQRGANSISNRSNPLQNLHRIEEEVQTLHNPQASKNSIVQTDGEIENYEDCDGESVASTAGSEHSLIKSSTSK